MAHLKALAARFRRDKSAKHRFQAHQEGDFHRSWQGIPEAVSGASEPAAIPDSPDSEIEQLVAAEAAVWRQVLSPSRGDIPGLGEGLENVRRAAEALLADMNSLSRRQSHVHRKLSALSYYETACQSMEDLLPESEQERAERSNGGSPSSPIEHGPWSVTSHVVDGENPYLHGDKVLLPRADTMDWSRLDEQELDWIDVACDMETKRRQASAVFHDNLDDSSGQRSDVKGKRRAALANVDNVKRLSAAGRAVLLQRREDRNDGPSSSRQPCPISSKVDCVAIGPGHPDDWPLPASPRHECLVCGDTKAVLDFPPTAPSSDCSHRPNTCTDCLESWLASEIDGKGAVPEIKCPECPSLLRYIDLRRWASPETFATYDTLTARAALTNLPEFAWCLTPGCGNGQLNPENANFMHCQACGYKQCLLHLCAWHTNESCEAYTYRTSGAKARDEEAKTQKTLSKTTKPCPGNGCGWRIEKRSGCDHVTCTKCRFAFCWQCLASHEEIKKTSNAAHQEWCSYHSKNLEVAWPFNMH